MKHRMFTMETVVCFFFPSLFHNLNHVFNIIAMMIKVLWGQTFYIVVYTGELVLVLLTFLHS